MATVELRGPCNHLVARLDTDRRLIERKCPQCSQAAGEPVFHYFDAETGEVVPRLLARLDEARAAGASLAAEAEEASVAPNS